MPPEAEPADEKHWQGMLSHVLQLLDGAACCAPRSRGAPSPPAVFAAGRDEGRSDGQERQVGAEDQGMTSSHVSPGARNALEKCYVDVKARDELRSMENLVASLADMRGDWKERVSAMQNLVQHFKKLSPSSTSRMVDLIALFCRQLAVQVHSASRTKRCFFLATVQSLTLGGAPRCGTCAPPWCGSLATASRRWLSSTQSSPPWPPTSFSIRS